MHATIPFRSTRQVLIAALLMATTLLILISAWPGDVHAAATTEAFAEETILPFAPADEGGAGLSGAGASEWLPFAVALGPALVLIAGLLWLTFGIDRSEQSDPQE